MLRRVEECRLRSVLVQGLPGSCHSLIMAAVPRGASIEQLRRQQADVRHLLSVSRAQARDLKRKADTDAQAQARAWVLPEDMHMVHSIQQAFSQW